MYFVLNCTAMCSVLDANYSGDLMYLWHIYYPLLGKSVYVNYHLLEHVLVDCYNLIYRLILDECT
jgi:hypothetical protein